MRKKASSLHKQLKHVHCYTPISFISQLVQYKLTLLQLDHNRCETLSYRDYIIYSVCPSAECPLSEMVSGRNL